MERDRDPSQIPYKIAKKFISAGNIMDGSYLAPELRGYLATMKCYLQGHLPLHWSSRPEAQSSHTGDRDSSRFSRLLHL